MAASNVQPRRRDSAGSLSFREQFSAAPTSGSLIECWMVPFEDARPVRTPAAFKGQRNFAGLWWCASTGRHVGFESWCERDHLMCLDFDPGVVGMSSQPFRITLPESLPQRTHVPDYFVRRANGSAVVVDVRPDSRVTPSDQEVFDATARLCASVGWGYRRVGDLPALFLANVRWLAGYRHSRCLRTLESAQIMEALASGAVSTISDLAAQIGDPVAVLPTIFHLLWQQRIRADLTTRRLHLGSRVWASEPA